MSNLLELQGLSPMALDATSLEAGKAFLVGELEKRDDRLMEPLVSVTWMRDIVAKTGGGYIDYTSNVFADYGTSGNNQFGIIDSVTNSIPLIQATVSKDLFRVFTFANNIKIPFIDQEKMKTVGRSLDQLFDNGLRLNYNKTLDQNAYFGFPEFGTRGLINNTDVVASNAALNGAATSRLWTAKTPTEIMTDINAALNAAWAACEFDPSGIPNQILLPPAAFSYINNTVVSSAGNISILKYLMENNIASTQGVNLVFAPCRQCIGAGTGATDRMVLYRNEENRVCMDIPVPLTRAMTQPDVNQLAFLTAYIGLIGQVKFLYPQTARYIDGI